MKTKAFLFILGIFCTFSALGNQSQEPKVIELPLTMHNGAGQFEVRRSFGQLTKAFKDKHMAEWAAIYPEIQGLPEGWDEGQRVCPITDYCQYVYQNYVAGKLSEETLGNMINDFGVDTAQLSATPIKCYVNIAFKQVEGGRMFLVDMDNDLDFADEEPFFVKGKTPENSVDFEDYPRVTPKFEKWQDGKVVIDSLTLAINPGFDEPVRLFLTYLRYATTTLDGAEVAVLSGRGNWMDIFFSNPVVIPDIKGAKLITEKSHPRYGKGDSFELNGTYYKLLGADTYRNVLRLEVLDGPPAQVNVINGTPITIIMKNTDALDFLKPYKGKYVFLDFWGTWCGPCRDEIPTLKEVYSNIDKEKIEFIGILNRSPEKDIENAINEFGITWPQMNDKNNVLVPAFKVHYFPTTFLIDPSGEIIEKDLRGDAVEQKLRELGLLK